MGRGDPTTPLDVFIKDIQYLEGRTGLDLQTPLENVAQAHDEIVTLHNEMLAVLNPIAGDKMQRDLEEQVAGLQQQLAVAHQQVGGNREPSTTNMPRVVASPGGRQPIQRKLTFSFS